MTTITLLDLNSAIASAVQHALPDTTIYQNPKQQGTTLPCAFITYRNANKTDKQIGNRFMRALQYDIVYMVDYNLTNLNELYLSAADALDQSLELFSFPNANPIRTLNRTWFVELSSLHYQFDIKARVSLPEDSEKMEVMDITEEVNEK